VTSPAVYPSINSGQRSTTEFAIFQYTPLVE
jgi:hypothetical protein